jgi:thiol-disulfide isomerase/thioredoxin
MTETKKSGPRFGTAKLAIAAIAGAALIGAVALYVKDRPSGNAQAGEIAVNAANCEGVSNRARSLNTRFKGDVAAMRAVDEEMSLAGLRFDGPDGKQMTLSDFGSKALLVNIWATWCVPCREEIPALDQLQAARGGNDFQVVAINIDTGDGRKPTEFLKKVNAGNLSRYRDSSLDVFNKLKAQGLAFGLPVTLLVDSENCLLAAMNGPADWAGADAAELIDAAIAASKS